MPIQRDIVTGRILRNPDDGKLCTTCCSTCGCSADSPCCTRLVSCFSIVGFVGMGGEERDFEATCCSQTATAPSDATFTLDDDSLVIFANGSSTEIIVTATDQPLVGGFYHYQRLDNGSVVYDLNILSAYQTSCIFGGGFIPVSYVFGAIRVALEHPASGNSGGGFAYFRCREIRGRATVIGGGRVWTARAHDYVTETATCFSGDCPTGACCVHGVCVSDASRAECDNLGGTYLGDDSVCEGSACLSACCIDDGATCEMLNAADCTAAGGTLYEGESCDDNPSPCLGACCLSEGTACDVRSKAACDADGGTWFRLGTCTEVPSLCSGIEGPTGACCFVDSCTEGMTAGACHDAGGSWLGPGSTCVSCTAAALGACCAWDGACTENITEYDCIHFSAGSRWQSGGTCTADFCPTGACCLPTGSCTQYSLLACSLFGGFYQGDGSLCADQNCLGCCCVDGTGSETSLADCALAGGVWGGPNTICSGGATESPTIAIQTVVDCSGVGIPPAPPPRSPMRPGLVATPIASSRPFPPDDSFLSRIPKSNP